MNNIRSTLRELLHYYDGSRGVGHTSAVIAGAENLDSCIVVAANQMDVKRLREGDMFTVMSLSDLENGHAWGHRYPMVLDNHAITELARQSLAEIARLEDKIREIKAVAQAIADVNLYD